MAVADDDLGDVIVDLVSTGSTLRVNRLREVATILESTARVVVNPAALEVLGEDDGLDNDEDGVTDEEGEGDLLDNDCDGEVDEGITRVF